MGFLEGGGLKLYKKLALDSYNMQGGRFKAIQKIGFRKLWYAVLMGFLEGGGLKLYQKLALGSYDMEGGGLKLYKKLAFESYDMLSWWVFWRG